MSVTAFIRNLYVTAGYQSRGRVFGRFYGVMCVTEFISYGGIIIHNPPVSCALYSGFRLCGFELSVYKEL